MNAQERFLHRFDPDGDGFIYRAGPHAPGVSVTAEERAEMIALDDDRGGIATILYVVTVPLAAAVGVSLSMNSITSPWANTVASLILFGLPVAVGFWVFNGPNRILRGRPYVDKGLPRIEAERREVRQRSWPVLIITALGGVAAGFNLARWTEAYMILRLLGALFTLMSIAMFAHEVKIKVRVDAYDRHARTGKP